MIGESIDQEAERLRRERRAKMLEIKENMANSLWNRDSVTSAPAVREVDEYNEELTGKYKNDNLKKKPVLMTTKNIEDQERYIKNYSNQNVNVKY